MKELPRGDRPRERLLMHGAQVLADAEVLGILLGTGRKGETAVQLGQRLLHRAGPSREAAFRWLRQASPRELMEMSGLGPAKAAVLLAAVELGRRLAESVEEKQRITSPTEAKRLVGERLRGLDREHLLLLSLDLRMGVLGTDVVSVGDVASACASPREVFRTALGRGAAQVILAHNHPSGDPTPSAADVEVTARLVAAGELLGIAVVDHVVVGEGRAVSMREQGLAGLGGAEKGVGRGVGVPVPKLLPGSRD